MKKYLYFIFEILDSVRLPQLKINVIILEDRFHSELEVTFIQFSKTQMKILWEFQCKMYSNLEDTTEIMVKGSKFCHVEKYGIQDTIFSHHNIGTRN